MVNIKGLVTGVIVAIIGLIVVMTITGETITDVQTAGDTINATGAPLSGLFASDSVVPLIFLAGVLLAVIGMAFGIAKHG